MRKGSCKSAVWALIPATAVLVLLCTETAAAVTPAKSALKRYQYVKQTAATFARDSMQVVSRARVRPEALLAACADNNEALRRLSETLLARALPSATGTPARSADDDGSSIVTSAMRLATAAMPFQLLQRVKGFVFTATMGLRG